MVLPSSHSPNGNQSVAGNEDGSGRPSEGEKKHPWKRSDSADGTYTDIPDLAAYNGISNPDVISVGQVIRKPRSGNNNQNGGTAYMFGVRVITLGA